MLLIVQGHQRTISLQHFRLAVAVVAVVNVLPIYYDDPSSNGADAKKKQILE